VLVGFRERCGHGLGSAERLDRLCQRGFERLVGGDGSHALRRAGEILSGDCMWIGVHPVQGSGATGPCTRRGRPAPFRTPALCRGQLR
jgi:hypothetical protein